MMGPEELGRLIDRHAAALVLYARQWCSTPEDVVQEAFMKLAAGRCSFERVVPWLYTVVRRAAMTATRSERRRRHREAAAARAESWFDASPSLDIEGADAARALAHLPIDQREAIVAHLWGELTFDEIGRLTQTSAATAHRRYVAGLTAMREKLRSPCPNISPRI